MLPLESFAVGVPCIVGPNTPYFTDDTYLQDRLVVKVADDAQAIARCIERALAERDEIVAAYREHAILHNAESARTVARFLDF
jgi:glycosyltransferase involved in cell wall biosynthesis